MSETEAAEVLFYHLEREPVERVLPSLLEKTLERGWRAVVQAGSQERIEALDTALWTYDEASFLPHGLASDQAAARHPIAELALQSLEVPPDPPDEPPVMRAVSCGLREGPSCTFSPVKS